MKNMEGNRVPNVTFRVRDGHEWKDVSSNEIFAGKNVVVFSLPGAFTPTCSSSHVPRFSQLADFFRMHGIDEIVCISVNDAFVMAQWQKTQHAQNIRFLPDGNGEFTEAMGMLVDKSELGFGKRSWRYSMIVRNAVIDKMFIEPDVPGDPFDVSDADTMRRYLAPNASPPASVSIFARHGCEHCARAKRLLGDAGIDYEELMLNQHFTDRTLRAVAPRPSLPQVFIDGQRIGGANELEAWLANRMAA